MFESKTERIENIRNRYENVRLALSNNHTKTISNDLANDMEWLIEQTDKNTKLRKALEFYADEDNHLLVDGENTTVSIDSGKVARKALEEDSI